jgi:predicted transcriptional regulator
MRIRDDLLAVLGEIAARRGITRSHLMEQALIAFVDQAKTPDVNKAQGDLFA